MKKNRYLAWVDGVLPTLMKGVRFDGGKKDVSWSMEEKEEVGWWFTGLSGPASALIDGRAAMVFKEEDAG